MKSTLFAPVRPVNRYRELPNGYAFRYLVDVVSAMVETDSIVDFFAPETDSDVVSFIIL